jgi:peptidoglycan/LPS O-acetylase OafA/YrhL
VPTSRPQYWPALDGLRAVAVSLVIGYHASGALGNGYLGVDVFFVLSGFLITSLLLREQDATGRIDIGAFYLRRVLRLYPALVVVCVAVTAAALVLNHHVRDVVLGALTSLLYVANVWEYSGHETYLLQHTWTLALEEQFYLVWPILLIAALRRHSAAWLIGAGWVAIEIADKVAGEPPVLHTYVRAAGLPLGCALAVVARRDRVVRTLRPLAGPCLLAIVVLACSRVNLAGVLTGWSVSLAAVLTVPVVAGLAPTSSTRAAAEPRGAGVWLVAILGSVPARWLGRRSYGLYLWHFPVLSVAINQVPARVPLAARDLLGVAVSLVVAAGSYRLIEAPFLCRNAPRPAPVTPAGT